MLLRSVAVPAIMTGQKGIAKAKAARLICQGISERMSDSFDEARIVCSDPEKYAIFEGKLRALGWDGGQ